MHAVSMPITGRSGLPVSSVPTPPECKSETASGNFRALRIHSHIFFPLRSRLFYSHLPYYSQYLIAFITAHRSAAFRAVVLVGEIPLNE
jgi:hypothetical protein